MFWWCRETRAPTNSTEDLPHLLCKVWSRTVFSRLFLILHSPFWCYGLTGMLPRLQKPTWITLCVEKKQGNTVNTLTSHRLCWGIWDSKLLTRLIWWLTRSFRYDCMIASSSYHFWSVLKSSEQCWPQSEGTLFFLAVGNSRSENNPNMESV